MKSWYCFLLDQNLLRCQPCSPLGGKGGSLDATGRSMRGFSRHGDRDGKVASGWRNGLPDHVSLRNTLQTQQTDKLLSQACALGTCSRRGHPRPALPLGPGGRELPRACPWAALGAAPCSPGFFPSGGLLLSPNCLCLSALSGHMGTLHFLNKNTIIH